MSEYFKKLHKDTQPIRDAVKPAPAPQETGTAYNTYQKSKPDAGAPVGQLQGESLEDFNHMRKAQDDINKKLAPKSVMVKGKK